NAAHNAFPVAGGFHDDRQQPAHDDEDRVGGSSLSKKSVAAGERKPLRCAGQQLRRVGPRHERGNQCSQRRRKMALDRIRRLHSRTLATSRAHAIAETAYSTTHPPSSTRPRSLISLFGRPVGRKVPSSAASTRPLNLRNWQMERFILAEPFPSIPKCLEATR